MDENLATEINEIISRKDEAPAYTVMPDAPTTEIAAGVWTFEYGAQ